MAKKTQKQNKQQAAPVKENPIVDYLLMAIFGVFIVLLTTFKISGDDDVFWHLATGRYIVETGSVPSTDVFGFISQGQEWMPFEWGWDVLTYGIYSFSGYNGISVFRTIIFLLLFYLFYITLRKFKVSNTVIFLFLTLLAFGMIDRLTPRPHIISFLFFAMLIYIITSYRYFNRSNYKILYFIPAVFLLWANMHMGIIAGIFLLGLYTVSEWIIYYKPGKYSSKEVPVLTKPELMRLSAVFGISVLVMLINPNFLATYLYAYSHTKMKLLETINEWRSPFDDMFSGGFVTIIYKIFLFGGLLVLYYSVKRKDFFAGLLFIAFAVYSVRAVRFTVDYILIILVFLAVAVDYIVVNVKAQGFKNFIRSSVVPKAAIAVFLLYCIINLPNDKLYLETLKYYRISGFGINGDFIPVQMFDFIKQHGIAEKGEKPFNHFGTGGYLVWNFPGEKNFIDSRNLNDEIFNEYNSIVAKGPGFEQKLEKHGIDYSMYLAPDLVRAPQEMEQSIVSYFSKNASWKLLFWDDKSFLFVKDIPKYTEEIKNFQYKYLTPYNFVYNKAAIEKGIKEDKETVKKELNRKMQEEPNGFITGSIYQTYGNRINN